MGGESMKCESCHYRDAEFPRDGEWLCIGCYDKRVTTKLKEVKDRETAEHHKEEASAGLI